VGGLRLGKRGLDTCDPADIRDVRVGSNPGLEATYTERDSTTDENRENRSKSRARNRHYLLFRAERLSVITAVPIPPIEAVSS
jgi:hypothetical protein